MQGSKPPGLAQRSPSARGRVVLALDWWPRELPPDVTVTPTTCVTFDGHVTRGVLYERASSRTVVGLMHPRQDMTRAPQVPDLLEGGVAVWAQNSRTVNNDLTLSHEESLLDIAAGTEFLRQRGFEHVVWLGISGGASLLAYYTEQALVAPEDRVARDPAGRRVALAEAPMPPPDALVLLAPHPGQGRLLQSMIDPSVIDESDPLGVDPALDPFDPANGFAPGPEGARYDPDFVKRYRAAQLARVQRIDERARAAIDRRQAARRRFKQDGDSAAQREAVWTPVLTTYRTDADLRSMDLSLDPSERRYGSIISDRPQISNYGLVGFARLATPEAWLSTWSGQSSLASLERSAPGLRLPTLVLSYTADQAVHPSDLAMLMDEVGSTDKTHARIAGDHFGRPLDEESASGATAAMAQALSWLSERGLG